MGFVPLKLYFGASSSAKEEGKKGRRRHVIPPSVRVANRSWCIKVNGGGRGAVDAQHQSDGRSGGDEFAESILRSLPMHHHRQPYPYARFFSFFYSFIARSAFIIIASWLIMNSQLQARKFYVTFFSFFVCLFVSNEVVLRLWSYDYYCRGYRMPFCQLPRKFYAIYVAGKNPFSLWRDERLVVITRLIYRHFSLERGQTESRDCLFILINAITGHLKI